MSARSTDTTAIRAGRSAWTWLLPALFLSACEEAKDTTSPATGDTALDQSARMGTTTQQQVSGTQAALGDATSGTSTAATVDQYGPTGGSAGTGDATADTTAGGEAGGITGTTATGMAGSTPATGRDAAVPSGNAEVQPRDRRDPPTR